MVRNSPYFAEKLSSLAENCPAEGNVKTHFITTVLVGSG